MTLVGYDCRINVQNRRLPTVAQPITILMSAGRAVWQWQQRRAEARALEALPFDLRKDLGWPSADRPTRAL